jgi:hypothetical protein
MAVNAVHTAQANEDRENRECDFDAYYRKIIDMQDRLERIRIVAEALDQRYKDYQETRDFVYFLRNVEEIFVHASEERWSMEKTEEEMIKSEIYLLSKTSGVEESVFLSIYEEFAHTSHDVEKIQFIARKLQDQYSGEDERDGECRDFIAYVRDTLLVFAHALHDEKEFDEIIEIKARIIRLHMEAIASDNVPPLELLQEIYLEFMREIKK